MNNTEAMVAMMLQSDHWVQYCDLFIMLCHKINQKIPEETTVKEDSKQLRDIGHLSTSGDDAFQLTKKYIKQLRLIEAPYLLDLLETYREHGELALHQRVNQLYGGIKYIAMRNYPPITTNELCTIYILSKA